MGIEAKLMQPLGPRLRATSGQNVRDFEDVDLPKLEQEIQEAQAVVDQLQWIHIGATGRRHQWLR